MRTIRTILLSCLAALCESSIAQPDQSVPTPQVAVGDRWVYRSHSNRPMDPRSIRSEVRVTFVNSSAIVTVSSILQVEGVDTDAAKARLIGTEGELRRESESSWTPEWNAVSGSDGSVFNNHSATFNFPLTVGKTYRADYEMTRPRQSGFGVRHQRRATVIGWEDVVVPAGKFRALRIDIDSQFQRLDTAMRGSARFVYWYVPEVKRWVKSTFEDNGTATTELIEFEVR